MGRLDEAVNWTLIWIHVIQSVVRADRVGVCGCPGPVARTGKGDAGSARRALYLTSGSGTYTYNRNGYCAHRSREERLRAHVLSPFLSNGLLLTQ
jgi:hypothetical protein